MKCLHWEQHRNKNENKFSKIQYGPPVTFSTTSEITESHTWHHHSPVVASEKSRWGHNQTLTLLLSSTNHLVLFRRFLTCDTLIAQLQPIRKTRTSCIDSLISGPKATGYHSLFYPNLPFHLMTTFCISPSFSSLWERTSQSSRVRISEVNVIYCTTSTDSQNKNKFHRFFDQWSEGNGLSFAILSQPPVPSHDYFLNMIFLSMALRECVIWLLLPVSRSTETVWYNLSRCGRYEMSSPVPLFRCEANGFLSNYGCWTECSLAWMLSTFISSSVRKEGCRFEFDAWMSFCWAWNVEIAKRSKLVGIRYACKTEVFFVSWPCFG